ncbi:MAG: thiamine pyrophosphate-binding protein [Vicinamibacteria bacterium]|nr:thiamine pyrophosphate-binding protein [Vicinamibacteria bacterium]
MHGGERVVEVLRAHGVTALFTLCGGHISPILVAAKAKGIRVVDTRHEVTAAFAADAMARLTGIPGVAAVTAGPGVTNTITALKNAQMAQSPLVLLGGATATLLRGRGSLQDIDQMALVKPHVKLALRVTRVRDLAPAIERALRTSIGGVPGPVFVECPVDLLYPEHVVREWHGAKTARAPKNFAEHAERAYVDWHLGRVFGGSALAESAARALPAPPEAAPGVVEKAASLLRRAQRPLLLVGSQALLDVAGLDHLTLAVRALGVPVYLSGMARGLMGVDEPLQLRHKRKEALREADLVILAGVPCDFRLDYGRHVPGRAVLIAANRSRADARRNRRPTVAAIGAPERFLRALAVRSGGPRKEWAPWLAALRGRDAARDAEIAAQADAPAAGGLNPLAVCRALDAILGRDSVIVADGGDFVGTASYVLRPRGPLSWLDPGPFGTLGVGAGFAIGAKVARPHSDVFVVFGDGSFGYSLAEFDTFARHRLGIVALIGNDGGWTQIAREQVEVLKDDVGTVLARTDYERAAEGLGGRGFRLESGGDLDATLRQALAGARAGHAACVNALLGQSDFRKGSLSI